MILMSHPEHGFTHVYDDLELAERKAKGWSVVTEYNSQGTPAQEREEKPKRKYTRRAA